MVSKHAGGGLTSEESCGRRLGMEDGYRSLKSRAEKKVGQKPNKTQRETVSKAAQETAQK